VQQEIPKTEIELRRQLYFPTLIFFADLPGAGALNEAMKPHIYAWRDQDPDGRHFSNVRDVGAWQSFDDMHRRAPYAKLVEAILAATQVVFGELGYDPDSSPQVDNMWANINPRYGYNRSHTHGNVLWSGVYYVQTPQNCGRIRFMDPREQAKVLLPRFAKGARKPECWSEVYYEAVAGRLILFPAWLAHDVEPNLAEADGPAGDRISVSFNVQQRRAARQSPQG
jgi:uncharacterized protein (TIGR02466 family)